VIKEKRAHILKFLGSARRAAVTIYFLGVLYVIVLTEVQIILSVGCRFWIFY
jgi:hypothetical protein